jgi:hypothetical protein
MALLVTLHYNGKFLHGPEGAYYSKPPSHSFVVQEGTSLSGLKSQIYDCVGFNPNRCDLKLSTRAMNGPMYIQVPIDNDPFWSQLCNKFKEQGFSFMELYVKRIKKDESGSSSGQNSVAPNYGQERVIEQYTTVGPSFQQHPEPVMDPYTPAGPSFQPHSPPDMDPYNPVTAYAEPYTPVGPYFEPTPEPPIHNTIPLPLPQSPLRKSPPHPRPLPVPADERAGSDFENMNEIPEYTLETADEYEGEWDSDHLEGLREDGASGGGEGSVRINPLNGRASTHPFECFNDTSGFQEADIGFFGARITYSSDLAAGLYFRNKADLNKKINEYHVDKNQEVERKKSDKTRMVVVCKDKDCSFKLRAQPTGDGDAWVITEQNHPHTCRTDHTRTDNAMLTASIIADIIEDSIKKDPAMSIQSVANCVRVKYNNCEPRYNRLWRGRELAIARQFGSWEGSYSFLPKLLIGICDKNPGSKYKFVTSPIRESTGAIMQGVEHFVAVAWAFGPCIAAFRYLRPVISIDACFMSGRYEGRLLIACAYDAENQLLPLAFAIVEKESGPTWGFFLQWLRKEVIGVNTFV